MESLTGRLCCVMLLAVSLNAAAQPGAADADGYNEYTIRASHYPADAPRFADYPAKIYQGPLAPTQWRATPQTRMFRTRLTEAGKKRPDFAGHYKLAAWGCGTSCTEFMIIDVRTGKISQPEIALNSYDNVHDDLYKGWEGDSMIRYKADSRLLVLIGMPNENPKLRGISFYEWTGTKLKLIRRVPVAWYPDPIQ